MIVADYRAAITAVRPDLAPAPMRLHTRGWDSVAVEADGTIFKFPRHPEAILRLRVEARLLALVRPRVPLRVPEMRLHESPILFSEHPMIPGDVIETRQYEALPEARKQEMAETLARFYVALHAIPLEEAIAAGAGPKPQWPRGATVVPVLAGRLPGPMVDFARRAFAAYEALPEEEDIFGYFDAHGWNMAFDHERGVLNGVYDFADAAIGPVSREFTCSNLTSSDLTARMVAAYGRLTGRAIDLRTVAIRTAVKTLSDLADTDAEIGPFLATAGRWHDHMQADPVLRV